MKYIHDLSSFTYHQAMSCIFPVVIFGTLALSTMLPTVCLPRYDFILLVCIGTQIVLLKLIFLL
ncbi:DUF817 family protein [Peribacillus loiseleuriae]|uniref:DUF817 family protein n=1 Tax=Peribacillus loiseleuriae TaxID=1679170 RepID=UPI0012E21AA7|nr:DUF817 family protein [Peribacillus loiseleuriae]